MRLRVEPTLLTMTTGVRLSHASVEATGHAAVPHAASLAEGRVDDLLCLLTGAFEMGDPFDFSSTHV